MNHKIGEFEEIVLLFVAAQHEEAYGLSVTKAIEKELGRSVTMSSVHTALYRLEEKGLVESKIGDAEGNRRGRRKRIFVITAIGKEALIEARDARMRVWDMIPDYVMKFSW
ncbi:MAG: helix-turn-helix transcriptional regulator [Cytophagia bacterium]|nr:helix-turn-helix transcriptional regulator [Cytophagia bacterium]NVK86110.1 helix-turn-helix transcriptional regulator [Cytophagia bacterium]